jgi:putative membrane protein
MNKTWTMLFLFPFAWSAVEPRDYLTWLLEVFPAIVTFGVLVATRRQFPLTPLGYWLLLIECNILMIGGHYTYAHVPAFDWLRDYFHHSRNNFDKLAHFSQGFVPAIVVREILIRFAVVRSQSWLAFLVVCVCLAISALYELIEWWVALVSEQAAEAFLGTQGYEWDTQSDMAFALVGAIFSIALLSDIHDAQIRRIAGVSPKSR